MKTLFLCQTLVILSTLIVIVQSQQCPPQCSCYRDPVTTKTVIDCSNQGLMTVPDFVNPLGGTIAKIDLSNNQLTALNVEQVYKFIKGSRVEVLDFSSNAISDVIGTFDFNAGVDYETLNLSNNGFTSFPENVIPLNHLPNELILDFSNNRLTELTRHMFAGSDESVLFGFQFLARNNLISQIHDETFQGITITDTVLDLRSNRLTTFSPTFKSPAGVREFRFSGNPWNCDCNLRWIIDPMTFLVNHTANDPPNCATPVSLQGQPIFGLKSNEFTCLPFQQGSLTRNIVNQDSFTLSCPVTADPPNPEITWTVWLPCPSEVDPLELIFTSNELTLSNIDINPRAAFRCTAKNNAGSVNFDLDIRVNGEAGISIPGTSGEPPNNPTVPQAGMGSESTMRPVVGNTASMMASTMSPSNGDMNNVDRDGPTTVNGNGGNNEVIRRRPVAGIIILVIILLVSWGVIGFLVFRIWRLREELRARQNRSGKVNEFSNGNTENVAPVNVEYNTVKHQQGSNDNGTTLKREISVGINSEPKSYSHIIHKEEKGMEAPSVLSHPYESPQDLYEVTNGERQSKEATLGKPTLSPPKGVSGNQLSGRNDSSYYYITDDKDTYMEPNKRTYLEPDK